MTGSPLSTVRRAGVSLLAIALAAFVVLAAAACFGGEPYGSVGEAVKAQPPLFAPDAKVERYYFNATWCGPCKKSTPVVFALKKKRVEIAVLDVDWNRPTVERLEVTSVPSYVVVLEGKVVARHAGALDAKKTERFFRTGRP